jgi:hypothetical protein
MASTASAGYTLLNEFLPEMLQYCNGAPSIMLRIHLINSAIELCEKSGILKRDPSAFQLEEDVHTYTLKYPQDRYRAIAVDAAQFENDNDIVNQPLTRTTEREMDGEFSNWRATKSSIPTRYWLTEELNKIRFWPTPNADIDNDMQVESVVTYKRGQTEVDEYIFEKWHEPVQAGALSRVLLITGASWFNERLALTFSREFSHGKREARKVALTGTGKYPGRVIPQSYDVMGSNANRRSGSWV